MYVCGDAKMMAKDVRNIVKEISQVKALNDLKYCFCNHIFYYSI